MGLSLIHISIYKLTYWMEDYQIERLYARGDRTPIFQREFADDRRAIATGVKAFDLVVLHPVCELINGKANDEDGNHRAQHKEDHAHKAAVPKVARRVGFNMFRKRLAARGTDDVRGAERLVTIGALQTGNLQGQFFPSTLYYTSRKIAPAGGGISYFYPMFYRQSPNLCYNTEWIGLEVCDGRLC